MNSAWAVLEMKTINPWNRERYGMSAFPHIDFTPVGISIDPLNVPFMKLTTTGRPSWAVCHNAGSKTVVVILRSPLTETQIAGI